MADTIIGTTGIFFTLALIALLSFLVGLVLYTLSDYFRLVFSHRNRAARRRAHGGQGTGAQGALGDAVVRAALHAADAWIQHARRDGASERMRWTVAAEFAAAMLAAAEHGARGRGTAAGQGRLAEVLTDVMTLDLDQAMGSV
jgi:hypothetical protein